MYPFGFNSLLNFNPQSATIIQEFLNRTDLKLEDLLDEEAVITEVRVQNKKLLDFLLDTENFKRLINYIITEPEIDDLEFDQKRVYKFPYVCADLLSSECNAIINEFFKSKTELEEAEREEMQREIEMEKDEKDGIFENNSGVVIEKEEFNKDSSPQFSNSKTVESNELSEEEAIQAKKDGEDLIYLSQLFTILDLQGVNLTCAGYFVKVLNSLFSKKATEIIAFIYKNNKVLLDKLVNHIASKSIAELLSKLLTFESAILDDPQDEVYNTERIRTLNLILQKLETSKDAEEINNSAYLICEVFGKYNDMHRSHEILGKLLEKPAIDTLFRILNQQSSVSSCATALVLGNIFAYYILVNTQNPQTPKSTSDEVNVDEPNQTSQHHQHTELSSDIPLVSGFIENIKSIVGFLGSSQQSEDVHTQFGTNIKPFGASKLKFLELLIISMKAGNKEIYTKLIENNFFEILLKFIVDYEWNNMLHNQIEKILNVAIDGTNEDLKVALFEKADLLNFIVKAADKEEYKLPGKHERPLRRGYLGHLVKIANRVNEKKDPVIEKYTQNNAAWNEFVKTKLKEVNDKENAHLGGKDPRAVPESINNPTAHMELPSIMDKFAKFFTSQTRVAPKDLDDDDEEEIEQEDIEDHDEEIQEDEALKQADMEEDVPIRGRSSFGFKNDKKVGEEEEDGSNVLWFSDPVAEPEKKEETVEEKIETQAPTEMTDEEKKAKEEVLEGEGYPTQIPVMKNEDLHTAEDLLKEIEEKIE